MSNQVVGLTADEVAEVLTEERRRRGIEVDDFSKKLCRDWWDTALMKLEMGGLIIVRK
jgi:hypothetical protein